SSTTETEDARFGTTTGDGGSASITLGHIVRADATSLADQGLGPDTSLLNRGGDLYVTQTVDSPVTIAAKVAGGTVAGDLNISNLGASAGSVVIGSNSSVLANSGLVDDGDTIFVDQFISGALQVSGVQDLIFDAGSGKGAHKLILGHVASQSAQSGRVDSTTADDFGGAVQASQAIVDADISLTAAGAMSIAPSSLGATTTKIGHSATQTAKTAGDTAEPVPAELAIYGSQSVNSAITLAADTFEVNAIAGAHQVTIGSDVAQTLEADGSQTVVQGRSILTGNIALTASAKTMASTRDNPGPVAPVDPIALDPKYAFYLGVQKGSNLVIGHSSANAVNGTRNITDGTAMGVQSIDGAVSLKSGGDIMTEAQLGSSVQVGHTIVQTADLLRHPLVVLPGVMAPTRTRLEQTITNKSAITIEAADDLTLQSLAGSDILVGHSSPDTNASQVTDDNVVITPQSIKGQITLTAGYKDGVAGIARADGETETGGDLSILAAGGNLRVGHVHADALGAAKNATQTVDADILVKALADLAVVGNGGVAAIGHAHYDLDDVTSDAGNTTPDAEARNRIAGLTTIGAVQYATSLGGDGRVPGAFVFENAQINSGYAEAGGQLRFFSAARENLRIGEGTSFNDAGTGDT
ncbi:MAG: hypothetical protein EBU97_03945, partial [Rhodobacteraceae bacterium]|nr:hypothetical protein [Paracoccaceae bacterium]